MTYKEATEYLFTQTPVFQRDGQSAYKPGLDRTNIINQWAGNPDKKFLTIHVGGTNGKGSVSHMLASVLQECGYKTGLYTSPHLKDFRERIKINGEMISESGVVDFVKKSIEELPSDLNPSFFELTTIMAFDWLSKNHVDIAIIEVGLGGRLDSTNIINPIASVITNISFDHMYLLGSDLEKIAFEKAGIIKNGVPVIIGKAEGKVKDVFSETAKARNSDIYFAGEINNLETDLKGLYQKENLGTVIKTLEVIKNHGIKTDINLIKSGLSKVVKNTNFRGRWETISNDPLIICDTAHNEAGIEYVVKQLSETSYNNLHFVIGMVNDKDIRKVLSLLPKNAVYYFTKASIPRALDEKELKNMALQFGLHGSTYPGVEFAINEAKKNYRQNDLIFVGGSNFIVAEAI